MSSYLNISSDILCHIFSNYMMNPWLSKEIYKACSNSQLYIYGLKKHKLTIIRNFTACLDNKYVKLLKRETLDTFLSNHYLLNEQICHKAIDNYYKYIDNIYKWWHLPIMYLQSYKTDDKNAICQIIIHKLRNNKYIKVTREESIFLIKNSTYICNTLFDTLDKIHDKDLIYNHCMKCIYKSGDIFEYIPRYIIDYKLCIKAIENGTQLYKIPGEYLTFRLFDQNHYKIIFHQILFGVFHIKIYFLL